MPSFDIVSEANAVEIKNAFEQTNKEITTRFDFKGSSAKITLEDDAATAFADNDFQLGQVRDVFLGKLTKRGVDLRFLDAQAIEKIGGDRVKQILRIRQGIAADSAKKIIRAIKDSKIKVQASIQGESIRVNGAKRDDLQATIAMLRSTVKDLPLEYTNFRD